MARPFISRIEAQNSSFACFLGNQRSLTRLDRPRGLPSAKVQRLRWGSLIPMGKLQAWTDLSNCFFRDNHHAARNSGQIRDNPDDFKTRGRENGRNRVALPRADFEESMPPELQATCD